MYSLQLIVCSTHCGYWEGGYVNMLYFVLFAIPSEKPEIKFPYLLTPSLSIWRTLISSMVISWMSQAEACDPC